MKKTILAFLVLGMLSISTSLFSQTLNLVSFATGLTKPTDIKNAGDSRLFVCEQAGKIRIVDSLGNLFATPFLDIDPIVGSTGNEQGLLGLAFHPNYASNGYFFVDYTDNNGHTHISRFSRSSSNPNLANSASEVNLLTIYQPYTNHNGGSIQFGPDGYLYISMGDGGSGGDPGARAQNKDSLLGKILRIDVNNASAPYYANPSTNPFVGATPGRDEIWAYGVRNPWRTSFDRITGDFWIADVGQNTWEEIDFQAAGDPGGRNYGWKCYEGFATYSTCTPTDTVNPIAVYNHSGGACSVTGGYMYRGANYAGLWGYYLYVDYCSNVIRSIKSNGAGGWIINNSVLTFSLNATTFGEDYHGEMYVAKQSPGTIYKIQETSNCAPVAFITMSDSLHGCDSLKLTALSNNGLHYTWIQDGTMLAADTLSEYYATSTGWYKVQVTNNNPCSSLSDSVHVTIDITPTVSFGVMDSVYCAYEMPIMLNATPGGGVYSGPGVTGNMFYPDSADMEMLSIDYQLDNNGCVGTAYQTLYVGEPNATFSASDSLHGCDSLHLVAATGFGLNYQWIKDGVNFGNTSSVYASMAGLYSLIVTDMYACVDSSDSVVVSVSPTPTVTFTGLDSIYCIYSSTSAMTGNPTGGTWTGAGVSGNIFSPDVAGAGNHNIVYSYTDGNGCSGTQTITVTVDSCTSVESITAQFLVNLVPNPAQKNLTITVNTPVSEVMEVRMLNLLGEQVFRQSITCNAGINSIPVSLSHMDSGIYMVHITSARGDWNQKLIIQR